LGVKTLTKVNENANYSRRKNHRTYLLTTGYQTQVDPRKSVCNVLRTMHPLPTFFLRTYHQSAIAFFKIHLQRAQV